MGRKMIMCMTGAAGRIAYSLYNSLCTSQIFGNDVDIELRLIEVQEKMNQLEMIKMELEDCALSRVKSIKLFSENQQKQGFHDADLVIFLGYKPREAGMDRWQFFENNAKIFAQHGKNLELVAKKTCKSLVVSNPPNTNCLVLSTYAPSIPKQNFTSLTRLDYNRFVHHVSEIFKCNHQNIKNLFIWGNHSKYHFCDINFLEIQGYNQEDIKKQIKNFDSREVQQKLHKRGGLIADKMGTGGALMSAAKSIVDHLRDWFIAKNKKISMGVIISKSIYGLPKDICFSMPVVCLGDGNYRIIDNLHLNEYQQTRVSEGKQQLQQEKEVVFNYLSGLPKEVLNH